MREHAKEPLVLMKRKITRDILFAEPLERYVEVIQQSIVCSIRFLSGKKPMRERKTLPVSFELERYFQGEDVQFSCEVDIAGLTPFQQKVLREVQKIRYGRTITYSGLARTIGSRAFRAVGNALAQNPVPIVIPCHRVVARNGIGGYSGGVDVKARLLDLEHRDCQ